MEQRVKAILLLTIAGLFAMTAWAGFTAGGVPPMFDGAPIPDGSAYDEALTGAADALIAIGCTAEGAQVKSLLGAGKICEERVDSANERTHGNTKTGGFGININPDLMLKAGMEQLGFSDPAVQGGSALLAGTLAHELVHHNTTHRRERPAYIAEINKLCTLAAAEDTPEGKTAICKRIKTAIHNANIEPGSESVPGCETCPESGNANSTPSPPPYTPSGAMGYSVSAEWKLRIDGIWVHPQYVPTSIYYLPRRSGESVLEDNQLPSFAMFSKESEIWVEHWNHGASPQGGPGTGTWDQHAIPLDFKALAMTGDGPSRVFVGGKMANDDSIIREYTFLLDSARLGFQVRDLYVGDEIDTITGVAYHPPTDTLTVLDASQSALWSIDAQSGEPTILANSLAIPPLSGCLSLAIVSYTPNSAVYALTYELPDKHSIDVSLGTLDIVDNDFADNAVDSFSLYFQ